MLARDRRRWVYWLNIKIKDRPFADGSRDHSCARAFHFKWIRGKENKVWEWCMSMSTTGNEKLIMTHIKQGCRSFESGFHWYFFSFPHHWHFPPPLLTQTMANRILGCRPINHQSMGKCLSSIIFIFHDIWHQLSAILRWAHISYSSGWKGRRTLLDIRHNKLDTTSSWAKTGAQNRFSNFEGFKGSTRTIYLEWLRNTTHRKVWWTQMAGFWFRVWMHE